VSTKSLVSTKTSASWTAPAKTRPQQIACDLARELDGEAAEAGTTARYPVVAEALRRSPPSMGEGSFRSP